ncbi:heme-thiolate peroxidase [Antrodiella citrinella]|uniref:Heme-thiolate peroxidase n=1 Tax=Antrodiella citrinella TaxID=2447956 RepID=A0A4S4N377_9APHY|nr:heme-thiolate peroxidase [Antrodiella citrinella]
MTNLPPPTVVPPADPKNVQGDITIGFAKRLETAIFFIVDDVDSFRKQLALLVPKITTADQVANDKDSIKKHKQSGGTDLLKISGLNIAFSQSGLTKLGITDDLGDAAFKEGQFTDAQNLGDKGSTSGGVFTPDWIPTFRSAVHGIIIIAGDSQTTIDERVAETTQIIHLAPKNGSCHQVLRLDGAVRPGDQKGHEHFGFLDGISNPAIEKIDVNPFPGQETVRQGIILLGRNGDPTTRPAWALDGSFLAFRYLFQLVPEFNDFLLHNAIPGLTPEEGAEFLGARLFGRWKSGAPLDLAPLKDDPVLAADPQRNNNFRYNFPEDPQTQDRCPFAAHVRKTNPRFDLEGLNPPASTEARRIVRRGIPFGPELSAQEQQQNTTLQGRGLLFRCYQSDITNGFQFVQHSWANNTAFPPQKPETPGFDAIIGQAADPTSRTITGADPKAQTTALPLPIEWVVPKGGEYFFSPSIPALKSTFGKV